MVCPDCQLTVCDTGCPKAFNDLTKALSEVKFLNNVVPGLLNHPKVETGKVRRIE
ncbi:MAG: hypothetical protein WC325_09080 [Candidatus Bathyarchaeia archaeon]